MQPSLLPYFHAPWIHVRGKGPLPSAERKVKLLAAKGAGHKKS
jgi:hypothetical protein